MLCVKRNAEISLSSCLCLKGASTPFVAVVDDATNTIIAGVVLVIADDFDWSLSLETAFLAIVYTFVDAAAFGVFLPSLPLSMCTDVIALYTHCAHPSFSLSQTHSLWEEKCCNRFQKSKPPQNSLTYKRLRTDNFFFEILRINCLKNFQKVFQSFVYGMLLEFSRKLPTQVRRS